MAKKDKDGKGTRPVEVPVDLAARIGSRASSLQPVAPPPAEASDTPQRLDGPLPGRRGRPSFIGMEAPPAPSRSGSSGGADASDGTVPQSIGGTIASRRAPPSAGEIDVVVTPLATPDDWHRFEIAFRRVRGITQLRPEYYRHGVAKMRIVWEGEGRLAQALRAGIPGYRVRVIGEDRGTLQILVSQDNEERRPS